MTLAVPGRYEEYVDEKGEKQRGLFLTTLEGYQGAVTDQGYLEEAIIPRISHQNCQQGKRTKDEKGFCLACPPEERDYEDRDLRDWILRFHR